MTAQRHNLSMSEYEWIKRPQKIYDCISAEAFVPMLLLASASA
jgi:hypothetical protein